MSKALLVRGARQLLTLRAPYGPRRGAAQGETYTIEDGAILIEDGIITHLGPSRRIENLGVARSAELLDVSGRAVIPGFVDPLTHLIRGHASHPIPIPPGASPVEQIHAAMRVIRTSTTKRLVHEARTLLERAARSGTTTLLINSGYGLDEQTETKLLRIASALDGEPLSIVPALHAAHTTPPEYNARESDYIRWIAQEFLPQSFRRGLIRMVSVTCDGIGFTPEQLAPLLAAAREAGVPAAIHACRHPSVPAAGALSLLDGGGVRAVCLLESATAPEIRRLASATAVAVLVPGASFLSRALPPPPARQLIDSGVPVAIATGCNPIDTPSCSMPMAMTLACTILGMSPEEAIVAATINAAHALGVAAEVGTLEAGKRGDFLVLRTSDYRDLPLVYGHNLIEAVYRAGVRIAPTSAAAAA